MFKDTIKVLDYFSTTDYLVLGCVLFLTIAFVLYGYYKRKQSDDKFVDYMLMGRRLTLPLFIATLGASWYGGIFGVSEITFNYGIYNFITQGVFWYIAYIIFALFMVDKIKKYQSLTLPEMAGQMFGVKAHKTCAVFTFFNVLPIAYVLSLGVFLHLCFGISTFWGMVIGTSFVCLYASWGGLRAVVYSDAVQFSVMCLSVLLVLIFSLKTFGGISFLKTNLPAEHFSITGGNSYFNLAVWGFIALATLVDPAFYQRCFAAKDTKTAKKGILICTLIWLCFDICTTGGTLYARAIIPNAIPRDSYFIYAIQLLPSGLKGFFVAGILSVILSTLDSFLFIASNTIAYDLLKNKIKNKLLANQIFFIIIAALAISLSVFFDGSFKKIWFVLGSYMSACLLVPLIMGHIFPKKISDKTFTFSVIISAVLLTLWDIIKKQGFWAQIDGFYIGVLTNLLLLSIAVYRNKKCKKSKIS
ncbi:MAG: sodium:solute symporter family protein [Elusimicrobiaceae bacterium]|nr:sodium:solute symporter family protein [Elusimicrobiaceae bacterium]